jgi:hypothetical protein
MPASRRPQSAGSRRLGVALAGGAIAAGLFGCGGDEVPTHPVWSEVQPILAAACSHCHGATAADTGKAYRFDFYDMTREVCGDAVEALRADIPLGQVLAWPIWNAITTTKDMPDVRPSMPPPPAPYLQEREWKTIRNWLADGAPRGVPPVTNRPPTMSYY